MLPHKEEARGCGATTALIRECKSKTLCQAFSFKVLVLIRFKIILGITYCLLTKKIFFAQAFYLIVVDTSTGVKHKKKAIQCKSSSDDIEFNTKVIKGVIKED